MKASTIASVVGNVLAPYILVALGWLAYDQLQTQGWLHYAGFSILALLVFWNITPHFLLWSRDDMSSKLKLKASVSFLNSMLRGFIVMPFSILAWFVVPVILLFVKETDNRLPGIFELLFGDVNGIHGDSVYWVWSDEIGGEVRIDLPQTKDVTPEQREMLIGLNYFLPGVWQRTWASRVVWLLRNRATKMSERLGVNIPTYREWKYWGPLKPLDRMGVGSYVMQMGSHFEISRLTPLGNWFGKFPIVMRQRYGFKLGNQMGPFQCYFEQTRKRRSEVINIAYTFKAAKPPSNEPFALNPLINNADGSVSINNALVNPASGRPL